MFVAPKYLSEPGKEVSGRPGDKWIEEAVILKAKVLLGQSLMNVAKVAEALHFPNQSFFGKYFKKNADQVPSAYLRYLKDGESEKMAYFPEKMIFIQGW